MNDGIKKEIYIYLDKILKFTGNDYNYLVNLYGKENVELVIFSILKNERKNNIDLYNKIINYSTSDNTTYKLVNDVYMKYLYSVIIEMNKKFSILGFNNDKFNKKFIVDKVEFVNNNSNDIENVNKLNELYDEFLILRNVVAMANEILVNLNVLKFHFENDDKEELYQEGYIGLLRSIELYDPNTNFAFSTYANVWIKGFIKKRLNQFVFPIYVPFNSVADYRRYKREYDKFYVEYQREPTKEEMAKILNLSIDMVVEFDKLNESFVSIYQSLISDNDDTMLQDVLSVSSSEREIEDNIIINDLKSIFDEVLGDLKENEKKVIYYRFLYGADLTFREIGEILGFTKQAAHAYYTKALTRIRKNKDRFIDYL